MIFNQKDVNIFLFLDINDDIINEIKEELKLNPQRIIAIILSDKEEVRRYKEQENLSRVVFYGEAINIDTYYPQHSFEFIYCGDTRKYIDKYVFVIENFIKMIKGILSKGGICIIDKSTKQINSDEFMNILSKYFDVKEFSEDKYILR